MSTNNKDWDFEKIQSAVKPAWGFTVLYTLGRLCSSLKSGSTFAASDIWNALSQNPQLLAEPIVFLLLAWGVAKRLRACAIALTVMWSTVAIQQSQTGDGIKAGAFAIVAAFFAARAIFATLADHKRVVRDHEQLVLEKRARPVSAKKLLLWWAWEGAAVGLAVGIAIGKFQHQDIFPAAVFGAVTGLIGYPACCKMDQSARRREAARTTPQRDFSPAVEAMLQIFGWQLMVILPAIYFFKHGFGGGSVDGFIDFLFRWSFLPAIIVSVVVTGVFYIFYPQQYLKYFATFPLRSPPIAPTHTMPLDSSPSLPIEPVLGPTRAEVSPIPAPPEIVPATAATGSPERPAPTFDAEIRALAALLSDGLISQDEFNAKKRAILSATS